MGWLRLRPNSSLLMAITPSLRYEQLIRVGMDVPVRTSRVGYWIYVSNLLARLLAGTHWNSGLGPPHEWTPLANVIRWKDKLGGNGIWTHDTIRLYVDLANQCLKPLSHTSALYNYWLQRVSCKKNPFYMIIDLWGKIIIARIYQHGN